MGISKTPNVDYRGKPRKDFAMKTTAIFTRTLTTSSLSEIDLVRKGWQIKFTTTDGTVVATKQDVVEMSHPETAATNMTCHNTFKSDTLNGEVIITKIDFGPGKTGLVWNAKEHVTEAWLNKPVVLEKQSDVDDFDIDFDDAARRAFWEDCVEGRI